MRLRPFDFCCHWQHQNSSAVKAGALRAQLFNLIKKRYFIIVSLFGSSSKARTCDIHSLKLIVSSLLRKVLNNSFCTFIRLLFLPLAAQSSSAVKANALRARLLTFYTYFKFSLIVKQKRVENLLFFCFGSSSKARTCDITVNSRALYQLSY